MNPLDVWKILTVAQGCFSIGASIIFIFLFIRKSQLETAVRPWSIYHVCVVFFIISHCLLILATGRTAFRDEYEWGDDWFWFVGVAYLFSDITLIYIIRGMAIVYYEEKRKFKKNQDGNN